MWWNEWREERIQCNKWDDNFLLKAIQNKTNGIQANGTEKRSTNAQEKIKIKTIKNLNTQFNKWKQ